MGSWQKWTVVGVALLLAAACGRPADDSAAPVDAKPAPLVRHASKIAFEARFGPDLFTVDGEAGCTWFGEGAGRVALAWPSRHALQRQDDGRLAVVDDTSRTKAIDGQGITLTGGLANLATDRVALQADGVPRDCRTGHRVILVGDVVPVADQESSAGG